MTNKDLDLDFEYWRPAVGYEGYYEISSYGRLRRVATGRGARAGKFLKLNVTRDGYLRCSLSMRGKARPALTHRLVAEAFLGPAPTPEHEAAHWNGNRADPRLSNLRWATRLENKEDELRHGTRNRGERHGLAILNETAVLAIRKMKRDGVGRNAIATQFGVSGRQIHRIVTGQNWAHAGKASPC